MRLSWGVVGECSLGGVRKSLKRKKHRLYILQKGQCAYCSNAFPIQRLTFDHVIRKREGGNNHISNLVLACYPCNVRRELPENARESVMIRWAAWHREYLSTFGL